jgi:hypothetical protein
VSGRRRFARLVSPLGSYGFPLIVSSSRYEDDRRMDTQAVREVIRYKLWTGALPRHSAATVVGSPADGETCSACGSDIPTGQLMIDGLGREATGRALPFHVLCFEVWNDESRATEPRSILSARTLFGGMGV